MEQMASPEMFDSAFFSLDNSMPTQASFDNSQHASAQGQLQVPVQPFMPFGQQPYSHGYSHHQHSRLAESYPASPSWQLHSRQHQHAVQQYGNHFAYGIRHQPFALTQELQSKTTAETKARLDKKHVEILEQEFLKNRKPSSIVKRELAEQMGHEIARINNWFQNRRAKEKSNKRTAEYAAREEAVDKQRESSESTTSESQSSPRQSEDGRTDRSTLDSTQRPMVSCATIGEVEAEENGSLEQQHTLPSRSDGSANVSLPIVDEEVVSDSRSDNGGFVPTGGRVHATPNNTTTQDQFQSHAVTLSREFDYTGLEDFHGLPQGSLGNIDYMAINDLETAWFHPLPEAPSDYFGSGVAPLSLLNAGTPIAIAQAEQFQLEDTVKVEQLASPVSISQTPPPPRDIGSRFKSPRPINIAARRNHQRPAALGVATSRKASYCQGPKTGIEMPRRRADDTTPMRRTASATGLRRLAQVSEAGLRSPSMNFQAMRSPSYNSSTSPVSPSRADTPATTSSEEQHELPFGNFAAPLAARFGESSINTPPVTPGLPLNCQGFANPFDQAWAHAANDQPLATPSLCSHGGSEMDFPGTSHIPNYIASQPATPGFPRPDAFGPSFRFGHGGMANAPEYTFPDSSSYLESSMTSSPHDHSVSKNFHFAQNVTPQTFSER